MLYLYTGTPGSGKTLHATARIDYNLRIGRNVICNYPIRTNPKRHKGNLIYKQNEDLTVEFLVNFAIKNHERGEQSSTIIFIDEAHLIFNTRGFNMAERIQWLKFLAVHRHLGYDIILITQSDKAIDQQVRGLVEFNVKHRMASSYGFWGWIFSFLFNKKFIAVRYWYVLDEKVSHERFGLKKKITKMYDTCAIFDYEAFFGTKSSAENKTSAVAEFNKKRSEINDDKEDVG